MKIVKLTKKWNYYYIDKIEMKQSNAKSVTKGRKKQLSTIISIVTDLQAYNELKQYREFF